MIAEPVRTRNQGLDEKESQKRLALQVLRARLEAKRIEDHMIRSGYMQNAFFSDNINRNNIKNRIDEQPKLPTEDKDFFSSGYSRMQDKTDQIEQIQTRSDYLWNTYRQAEANFRAGLAQKEQAKVKEKEKVELTPQDASTLINDARNNPLYNDRKMLLSRAAKNQRKTVKNVMKSRVLTPAEKLKKFNELTGRIAYDDLYHRFYNNRRMKLSQRSIKPREELYKKLLKKREREWIERHRREQIAMRGSR